MAALEPLSAHTSGERSVCDVFVVFAEVMPQRLLVESSMICLAQGRPAMLAEELLQIQLAKLDDGRSVHVDWRLHVFASITSLSSKHSIC
jgi:hypothetical protein